MVIPNKKFKQIHKYAIHMADQYPITDKEAFTILIRLEQVINECSMLGIDIASNISISVPQDKMPARLSPPEDNRQVTLEAKYAAKAIEMQQLGYTPEEIKEVINGYRICDETETAFRGSKIGKSGNNDDIVDSVALAIGVIEKQKDKKAMGKEERPEELGVSALCINFPNFVPGEDICGIVKGAIEFGRAMPEGSFVKDIEGPYKFKDGRRQIFIINTTDKDPDEIKPEKGEDES